MHATVTASPINQLPARAHAQILMGAPLDDFLARPRKWLDRLVDTLTKIVEKFAKTVSSSISALTYLCL
jgi:hypothetical protein